MFETELQRARVLRELMRMNATMFDVEQAMAEIGELDDHEAEVFLINAEGTRGRLAAAMDAVRASNPAGAESFERRMRRQY